MRGEQWQVAEFREKGSEKMIGARSVRKAKKKPTRAMEESECVLQIFIVVSLAEGVIITYWEASV